MNAIPFWSRLPAVCGSAMLGAICGVLLAAFAHSVSSSILGGIALPLAGALVGGCAGRFPGIILGAVCGGLLTASCSVIGGMPLGCVLTVAACALLGGWLGGSTAGGRGRDDGGLAPAGLPAPAATSKVFPGCNEPPKSDEHQYVAAPAFGLPRGQGRRFFGERGSRPFPGIILSALLVVVPAAEASLAPRSDPPAFGERLPWEKERPRRSGAVNEEKVPGGGGRFILAETTEVWLDGRRCDYRHVPDRARVIRLEVAPDGKTALRVFFRSK